MNFVLDTTLDKDGIRLDKQTNNVYLGYDIYHWLTKKFDKPSKPIIKRRKNETSRFDRKIDLNKKIRKS